MAQDEEIETEERSIFWSITRWMPLGLLVGGAIGLTTLVFRGGMAGIMSWYLLQLWLPSAGVLTLIIVGVYAFWQRKWRSVPLILTASVAILATWSLLWTFAVTPIRFPASLEEMEPAASIRLPADGPLIVAWGGDTLETNYHQLSPDQLWAYDFVTEPAFSGSDQLEDYGCYGLDVLAPAAGQIVHVVDGLPDEVPGVLSNNAQNPAGNAVAIRLAETGTYLLIGHFKPNSIVVEMDQTVVEGDVLGQCGNSGNTSEPHIHIHHQRQNPAEFPIGFAEGLPLFFRDHDGEPMPTGGFEVVDDQLRPLGPTVTHIGP